jgi:hypothetical protein
MSDCGEELARAVTEHFGFLLQEQGFAFPETRLTRGERCVLFLVGDLMRVKFYRAPDEIQVGLGGHDASLTWGDTRAGQILWHPLKTVVGFLHTT